MKLSWLKILYVQVIIAIIIGILLGHFFPETAVAMKPLGDGFIQLIKMIIAPVIFCTVVTGIAGMENMTSVGKTGSVALAYFLTLTTLALFVGLVVVNIFQPGADMNIDVNTLSANDIANANLYAKKSEQTGFVSLLLSIIPKSFVGAFTSGEILQVLLVAILFGFALHHVGERGKIIFNFIDSLSSVIFKIINMIMRIAPLGAFGAISYTIGKYGLHSLIPLGKLIGCFYITSVLFIVFIIGLVARYCGFSIFKFISYIKEELLIVLGTSSSESALPNMLKKMEKLGCKKSVVDLVIPTGYSFNLDGTAIYLTMAAIFLAQATNTEMGLTDQLVLLSVLLVSSKGAAAVTGGAFIVLAGTLNSVGDIPAASIAIIFGIDRFMSEARALTNLIGNGVATVAVAKMCHELDTEVLVAELNNPTPINKY